MTVRKYTYADAPKTNMHPIYARPFIKTNYGAQVLFPKNKQLVYQVSLIPIFKKKVYIYIISIIMLSDLVFF